MSSPALQRTASTFHVELRSGVWTVTRDRVFYGDYFSREQALKSACSGARAVETRGGVARVLVPPGETLVPHGGSDE